MRFAVAVVAVDNMRPFGRSATQSRVVKRSLRLLRLARSVETADELLAWCARGNGAPFALYQARRFRTMLVRVGGRCWLTQVAQDFCLVTRRSRRVIPLHVGSGCHRRQCRVSKARIRCGRAHARVKFQSFKSVAFVRHLHSLGIRQKAFSRQLRRLGLDVERHWSVHDCEFWLCEVRKVTESSRSLLASMFFLRKLFPSF